MSDTSRELRNDGAADALRADIELLIERAESVNMFNPFTAFCRLQAIARAKRNLYPRLQELHRQYERSLEGRVSGPSMAIQAHLTKVAGQGISALLTVERSWHELGSGIDREFAFAFGYLSFYVAIIALLATVVLGVLSI